MGVRFDRAPPDEKEVAVLRLDAGPHFHALKSFGRFNQRARFLQRGLEFTRLAFADVQDCVLEDHSAALIFAAIGSSVLGSTIVRPCSEKLTWVRGRM